MFHLFIYYYSCVGRVFHLLHRYFDGYGVICSNIHGYDTCRKEKL